jgi:transcriptional regulator with XRE-family HTH domain
MAESAHSIDLKLPEKLQDRSYRKRFFLAEASSKIAAQLIALRRRRGKSQKQVAELVHTQQPAISRLERADYQNWSFSSLRMIADELDARIRVVIEPSEDILKEYEESSEEIPEETQQTNEANEAQESWQSQYVQLNLVPLPLTTQPATQRGLNYPTIPAVASAQMMSAPLYVASGSVGFCGIAFGDNSFQSLMLSRELAHKDKEISELRRKLEQTQSDLARISAEFARMQVAMITNPGIPLPPDRVNATPQRQAVGS